MPKQVAGTSNGKETKFNTGGDERTRIPPTARATAKKRGVKKDLGNRYPQGERTA